MPLICQTGPHGPQEVIHKGCGSGGEGDEINMFICHFVAWSSFCGVLTSLSRKSYIGGGGEEGTK